MTYQCKAVLKGLRILSGKTESQIAFLSDSDCFALTDDLSKTWRYNKFSDEIWGIIKILEQEGYLKFTFNEFHFQLTHHGLHPYWYKFETIKIFLVKSVLVPILISVITTLFTLWIRSL